MKRTHNFEIVGIGTFDEYPAKIKEQEYKAVNKQGGILQKKEITKGMPTEYGWLDKDGKVYRKDEVFYDINGKFVQKVNRTEKVNKFDIVPVSEALDLLESSTSFLEAQNSTTLKAFDNLVAEGKAIKFVYKKSSTGFKFVKAFIFKMGGELVMVTGIGKKSDMLERFKTNKRIAKESKQEMNEVVEVEADEINVQVD